MASSTVRCGPAKVVFSHALNCMLVELLGEGSGTEGDAPLGASSDPRRILTSPVLGAGSASSGTSGTSTPRLESSDDSGSESPGAAAERTPLRSKASSFSPMAGPKVTTLMLRNVPLGWSRATLTSLLDSKGFSGQYDFVYLPTNIKIQLNVGYAFLNFTTVGAAERFVEVFHGLEGCSSSPEKTLQVFLSEVQGLDANIHRYQNSPIMNETVPESYKPALFWNGHRVPFPAPTTKLKSLRLRMGKRRDGADA